MPYIIEDERSGEFLQEICDVKVPREATRKIGFNNFDIASIYSNLKNVAYVAQNQNAHLCPVLSSSMHC